MKRSTPLDRNIGAKVKYYRKLRGLSQKQLAAQLQTNGCDLTETMLGHIETGYRSTSIFEIDKLAEALKVDYNALFAQDWRCAAERTATCRFLRPRPGLPAAAVVKSAHLIPTGNSQERRKLPCSPHLTSAPGGMPASRTARASST